MFKVSVLCCLWDIEEEGLEPVLDRLQGELGVCGITVPVAGGPLTQLRRRRQANPRVFRSRGGLFFQPDESKYRSTRVRPIVSEWLKSRNPLATLCDACRRRDIEIRVELSTRRIGRLADRFTSCAVKSPFGDESPGVLCQHNPDVAEFFASAVKDLSENYPLDAIILRDLGRPFDTDLLDGTEEAVTHADGCKGLFDVCFCESCLQAAVADGIDSESALEFVRARLSAALDAGASLAGELAERVADNESVRGFIESRANAHDSLVESLVNLTPCTVAIHVSPRSSCYDRSRPLPLNRFEMVVIETAPHDCVGEAGLTRFIDEHSDAAAETRLEAQIPGLDPISPSGASLVKTLDQFARSRFSGVTLSHYGAMGGSDFTASKQAIRYALRNSRTPSGRV